MFRCKLPFTHKYSWWTDTMVYCGDLDYLLSEEENVRERGFKSSQDDVTTAIIIMQTATCIACSRKKMRHVGGIKAGWRRYISNIKGGLFEVYKAAKLGKTE